MKKIIMLFLGLALVMGFSSMAIAGDKAAPKGKVRICKNYEGPEHDGYLWDKLLFKGGNPSTLQSCVVFGGHLIEVSVNACFHGGFADWDGSAYSEQKCKNWRIPETP